MRGVPSADEYARWRQQSWGCVPLAVGVGATIVARVALVVVVSILMRYLL